MTRFKIWRDETMATRTSIRYIVIYSLVLIIATMFIVCSSIGASIVGWDYIYFGVMILSVGLIIKSAWNLADEIRYLKGGCVEES